MPKPNMPKPNTHKLRPIEPPTGDRLLLAIRRVMGGGSALDRANLLRQFEDMAQRSPVSVTTERKNDAQIVLDFLEYLYRSEMDRQTM